MPDEHSDKKYDEIDKFFEIDDYRRKLKDKTLEEIVNMGITDFDRGIVKNGIIIEKREFEKISMRCMPVYVLASLKDMIRRHKNLYDFNTCFRYTTKVGASRIDLMNFKHCDKLSGILNDLREATEKVRDDYYSSIVTEKVDYDFRRVRSEREQFRVFHWVSGNIDNFSNSYGVNKSVIATIYVMIGLSASDGKYVSEETKKYVNNDINIFSSFINMRYDFLYSSILRILGDAVSRTSGERGQSVQKSLKKIEKFDKELYIKMIGELKRAGVEFDDSQ